jgi:predicted  nucleic acid-binding Zn-ribbon protein
MTFHVGAWIALPILLLLFILQGFNFDLQGAISAFTNLPLDRQLLAALLAIVTVLIAWSGAMQAVRLNKLTAEADATRRRNEAVKKTLGPVDEAQKEIDTARSYLVGSDPDEALGSLQKGLSDADQQAIAQQVKNTAADLQERIDDIRARQKTVRDRLSDVISARKDLDPVLNELNQRQRLIDTSLAELEVDENKQHVVPRITDLQKSTVKIKDRVKELQEALGSLSRIRTELDEARTRLDPLQAEREGIHPLSQLCLKLRDDLVSALGSLEGSGETSLASRVESLTASKADIHQRMGLVEQSLSTLDAVRRDYVAVQDHHGHVTRSIAELEVDKDGRRLSDRMDDMRTGISDSRARLLLLKDALISLEGMGTDLQATQNMLQPLKSSESGIAATELSVRSFGDRLRETLAALESDGQNSIFARLDTLKQDKADIEDRIRQLEGCLAGLDHIRGESQSLLSRLNQEVSKRATWTG